MHLARQKVQITFFFRKKIEFRNEHNSCSFCGESHSSCSQKEELFWSYLARQKVQITFFSRKKMTFRKEQKLSLFVVRAILHVFERNYFVVLFWCIWQKVQITFFFLEWKISLTFRKEQKSCSFCGESHSSCFRKELFCSFLMHLAWQKVKITFFSRKKMTFRKEQKSCSFCGESHSSCFRKELFCCSFLMHLAKSTNNVLFLEWKISLTFRKEQKSCSFCGESHSSCFRKELFCSFLMHLARQKVSVTFK